MVKQGNRAHRRLNVKHIKHINWKAILIALLVTALAWLAWGSLQHKTLEAQTQHKLELKQQELQKQLKELDKTKANSQELQKQLEDTKKQLESKRAKQAADKAYAESLPVTHVQAPQPVISGSCGEWLAQAGITDTASAMALINGESHCNPLSRNAGSGACGVAQELPCGKSGCAYGDGACQVRWMNGYVLGRYGSWSNAYATWLSRYPHWY